MALFLNLYLGHLLGDFLFQPGRLVVAKREGAPGLLLHTSIVGACCALALVDDLTSLWGAVLAIIASHAAIELVTIAAYRATPTRGLFTFAMDQVLHILSIVLVTWLSGEWLVFDEMTTTFGFTVSTADLTLAVALAAVGLMGSILTFETSNTVLKGRQNKGVILRFDGDRIAGIAERMAGLALMFWLHPLAVPLAFLPRLLLERGDPVLRRLRVVEAMTGVFLCLTLYLVVLGAESVLDVAILP